MAIPQINNLAPVYEMSVPSTGQVVKFRPFLVKEQRNLLIALESTDTNQILNATLENIKNCVEDVNVYKLATFDVDYMFTQIRSKSVGETTDLRLKCIKCETPNTLTMPLSDIKLDQTKMSDPIIKLSNTITLEMKYPTYEDMFKNKNIFSSETSFSNKIFELCIVCIKGVYIDDEFIDFSNETREEIENFINNLTSEQMDMITEFVDGVPSLKYTSSFKCTECSEKNDVSLEGLTDFFS